MKVWIVALFSWLVSFEASALCVSTTEAELYEAPNASSAVVWRVFKFMPLKELAREGEWVRVEDVDGRVAWVSDRVVSPSLNCAVIQEDFAHLRIGPGTNFPKTKAARGEKYLSFELLKLQDEWALLKDIQGSELWISADLLWKDGLGLKN